ncbi:unnamed protein product [Cyprideis torosa]|uniref:Uncharacterized protein n=1 Tax=Cyprideis torosa TaxID=163714 RepID=A0A7R8X005_9CRUS|nr:unnamed protein product [Cyprideis torosa]CAG0910305.1 unnamed protein product [Cyprideis torosa]
MELSVERLTAEAFADFGDVIETEGRDWFPINQGSTQRFHNLADVQVGDGWALISIFRATPLPLPLSIELMERHPLGSQAFIPLDERPFLVVVAPRGEFNNSGLRCFVTQGRQGVNYAPGVWHHPVIALDAVSDFLVVDRGGEGNNCEEVFIPAPEKTVSESDFALDV